MVYMSFAFIKGLPTLKGGDWQCIHASRGLVRSWVLMFDKEFKLSFACDLDIMFKCVGTYENKHGA